MTAERHDARRPPDGLTQATGGPERGSRSSAHGNHAAWQVVGLAMLGHMLRSRRFYERLAIAAVVLAALASQSQDNRAMAFARLAAWNKRQVQFLEHKAEKLEHKAGKEARRLESKAKAALT